MKLKKKSSSTHMLFQIKTFSLPISVSGAYRDERGRSDSLLLPPHLSHSAAAQKEGRGARGQETVDWESWNLAQHLLMTDA